MCNSPKQLDVHHRTYERFGREDTGDLTVLCRRCHALHHGNKGPKPKKLHKPKPKGPAKQKSPKLAALKAENDRLHAVQLRNKKKGQLVREGEISPALRAELANRYRK